MRIDTLAKEGHTAETVEVKSNDPKQPTAILTLEADIMRNVEVVLPDSKLSGSRH